MEEKILDMLADICEEDSIKDDLDINLVEYGLIDSMGYILLLARVEEEFGIEISPTELTREEMDTPNKIISEIMKRNK